MEESNNEKSANDKESSSLFDRMKSFRSEIDKSNTLSKSRKHIYFDDDDSTDDVIPLDKVVTETLATDSKVVQLKKNDADTTFGFQVNGKTNKKGNHEVSLVYKDSCADRAGLKVNDKILAVNGTPVDEATIDQLIKLIEVEARKNATSLELVVKVNPPPEVIQLDDSSNDTDDSSKTRKRLSSHRVSMCSNEDSVKKKRVTEKKATIGGSKDTLVPKASVEDELDFDSVSFYSPTVPNKLPHVPQVHILNNKAHEIRHSLSECEKYVTWKEIVYVLLRFHKCKHIGEFGLTHATHLETINELIRYQRKIDSFILEYNLTISYATYYELEMALCRYMSVSCYSELDVGPLCENRLVRELFKLPNTVKSNDLKSTQLTYLDLFKHFRKYLDDKNLWSIKNIQISDFETYLMNKLDLDYVPVRVSSLAIMIGVMKNVKRLYNDSYKKAEVSFSGELKQIFDTQREMIKNELVGKLDDIELVNREPDFILNELLALFELILNENDSEYLSDFLKTMKSHDYLKYIFCLALFMIKQNDLSFLLDKLSTNPNNSNSYINILKRIFIKLVEHLTRKQLKGYLNKFLFDRKVEIVDFDSIKRKHTHFNENADLADESDRDEESVIEIKETTTQPALSEFMILNSLKEVATGRILDIELLKQLEECYYKLLNQERDATLISHLVRNKNEFESVFDTKTVINENSEFKVNKVVSVYLKQILKHLNTKQVTMATKSAIETLLCSQYDVLSIECIDPSFKNIDFLLEKLNIEDNSDNNEFIVNQDWVLDIDTHATSDCSDSSELEYVYQLLNDCPLLENLYEYTQWNLMYSQKYGSLKEFIKSSNIKRESNLVGYEVMPNCLLKLDSGADLCGLKQAISLSNDSQKSAGYLLSLVVCKYETLKKAPIMLISNELYSTYYLLYNKNTDNFYQFLLELMCHLPLKFLKSCLFKFFIEPMTKIEGSVQIVKDSLFKHVCASNNRHHENYFHHLSKLCCIPEWDRKNIVRVARVEAIVDKQATVATQQPCHDTVIAKKEKMPLSVSVVTEVSESDLTARQQIESIRLTKYGIGLTLNEQNEQIMKSLKNEISSCLQTLSNELYSKDMHFVLELIQNCDDNRYSSDTSTPAIVFLIDSASITLFNNEVGFKEKNIQAISSIGASTKGKHEHGYIGRKGIGFKSVFTVTNCPEIHSNEYHIKFDATDRQFGHFNYIVPIWCENNDNYESSREFVEDQQLLCDKVSTRFNTCIHLPLKSETEQQRHKSRSLTHSFNDIKSSLLLFLNRLKSITLFNRVQLTKRFYTRVDINEITIEICESNYKLSETLSEIQCEKLSQKWLIQRKNAQIPNTIDKPNVNIECTDVCLAFPLYSLEYTNTVKSLPKLDVYAYLPIRCYNFSFIIQADFMLTASRQDIINDSDWNQWLANEIPKLFVNSFQAFLDFYSTGTADRTVAIISAYLKFIPFDYEISNDFFQHIPKQIIQLVHNMPILPVLVHGASKDTLVLKKPYECIFIKDKQIEELLTHDLLESYLGRFYLNPKLYELNDGSIDENMLKVLLKLGVRQLQVDDIVNIIKVIFSSATVESVCFEHASKWLIILSNHLQSNDKLTLNEIRKLKFLPLLNRSELTSFNEAKFLYFPSRFNSVETEQENIDYLTSVIEMELHVLDVNRLSCLGNHLLNNSLISFLGSLGVKTLSSSEIIQNHIIPSFELAKDNELNTEFKTRFIIYVLYLFTCWSLNTEIISRHFEKLKSVVLVLVAGTNKFIRLDNQHLYLNSSTNDAPPFEIDTSELATIGVHFVDSVYLNESIKLNKKSVDGLSQEWRKFMNYFHVHDVFTPRKTSYSDGAIDYQCEVFEYFVAKTHAFDRFKEAEAEQWKLIEVLKKFFKNFQQNWSSSYKAFKYVPAGGESRFFRSLKTSKWILADLREYYLDSNEIRSHQYLQFLAPNEIFSKSDGLVSYFGEHQVAYVHETNLNKEFSQDIGLKETFIFNDFLVFFKSLCSHSPTFVKLKQIKHIYSTLQSHLSIEQLNELLESRFIFIPTMQTNDMTFGTFHTKHQVYWHDPLNIFAKYKHNLASFELKTHYSDLKIDYFKCNPVPKLDDYIALIEYLVRTLVTEKASVNHQLLCDLFDIYELIYEQYCCTDGVITSLKKMDFLSQIRNKSIFVCFNNKYLTQSDEIVLNDNFAVSKFFKEKLNFLILPSAKSTENYYNFNESMFKVGKLSKKLLKFLTGVCDFKLLSSLVETKIDLERAGLNIEGAPIPGILNQLLAYVQYYLFSKVEYSDIYAKFQSLLTKVDDSSLAVNLKMFQLNSINLNYNYKPNREISSCSNNDVKVFVRLNNENLFEYYIRRDTLNNEKELIKGFLKLFFVMQTGSGNEKLEKDLLNFILYVNSSYLKTQPSSSDKHELENDYDIKLSLPSAEPVWVIRDTTSASSTESAQVVYPACKNSFTSSPQSIDPLFSVYTELARSQQSLPHELSQLPIANNRNYITTNRTSTSSNNHLIADNSLNTFMHRSNVNSKLFLTQNFAKNEIVIDDLTHEFRAVTSSSEMKIQLNMNRNTNEGLEDYKNKVGQWGEHYIYRMLLKKHEKEIAEKMVRIDWINESNETGQPYDVKFIRYDENDWGSIKEEIYIEVKSTTKSDNELNDYFPVSVKEILFAMNNSASYHIYRLYNALNSNLDLIKVKRLTNIHTNLVKHNLNLVMIV